MKLSVKDAEEMTKKMLEDYDKAWVNSPYNPINIEKAIIKTLKEDIKNQTTSTITFFWNWLI